MKQFFAATVNRSDLTKALGHIQRIIEKRNTMAILANVLIEASGDEIAFRGTDLDIEATESVPAAISQPGAITVPAHLLYDIARKLPEGAQISLTIDGPDDPLIIRTGRSRFSLRTLPVTDYPALDAGDFPTRFTTGAASFKGLIDNCAFAISTEETRYYLNGIFLHTLDGDTLRAVATDGHRLARLEMKAPQGSNGEPGVILPRKVVGEVMKLLDEADDVTVSLSKAKVRFEIGKVVLTSKLIDGNFPDYARVIPTGNDKTVEVEKALIEAAVGRVATVSPEKSNAIKLSVDAGRVTLSVNNPDSGSASEEIDAAYEGSPFEIGFNAKYLLDTLAHCEGDRVTMRFSDAGSPTIFEGQSAVALYVLMPLRV